MLDSFPSLVVGLQSGPDAFDCPGIYLLHAFKGVFNKEFPLLLSARPMEKSSGMTANRISRITHDDNVEKPMQSISHLHRPPATRVVADLHLKMDSPFYLHW